MSAIVNPTSPQTCSDEVSRWPIALACLFPLAVVAIWASSFDLTFAAIPVVLVAWIASAVGATILALRSAGSRRWRRTFSLAFLPIVTIEAIATGDVVWPLAMETGERLHFLLMRRSYLDEVAKLPVSGEPRFAIWLRGGFGVGHGVVYDESDEILLREQTPAWKKRVANTEVGMCGAWGTRLEDHFYLVRTGC